MKKIPIETQAEWLKLLIDGHKGGSEHSEPKLLIYKDNNFIYEDGWATNTSAHTKGLYIIQEEVKLSDFLKQNNCYGEFVNNFDKELKGQIFKDYTNDVITNAFDWYKTKQGYDYWNDIDYRWSEIEHKVNDMLWLLDEPIEFNYVKITQPNTVVHCETEEQANELLRWADSKGLEWFSGISYMEYNNWKEYQQETCYCLHRGEYGYKELYEDNGYTILSFEEAKDKTIR